MSLKYEPSSELLYVEGLGFRVEDLYHPMLPAAAGCRLVFEAHRPLDHSILGWRVIKEKKKCRCYELGGSVLSPQRIAQRPL